MAPVSLFEAKAREDVMLAAAKAVNPESFEGISDYRDFIRKEWQNFYNYLQGGNPSLTSLRRETMFIQMLEGLHPKEAEIMVLVKDKSLQKKYKITRSAVEQAYPDIQWGGRS